MPSTLNVRVLEGLALTTIVLAGRLDNDTVALLDTPLDAVLASTATVLVFDLGELQYITSAGLRSILRAQKAMTARSGKALLLNPQPTVQKVFDIVKATDVGSVFRTVKELDAYLDAMQKKVAGRD